MVMGRQCKEAGIGLYFYGARWYDAALSRWIQPDSIVPDKYNVLDWDRYQYVQSNPLIYIDPSGHIPLVDGLYSLEYATEHAEEIGERPAGQVSDEIGMDAFETSVSIALGIPKSLISKLSTPELTDLFNDPAGFLADEENSDFLLELQNATKVNGVSTNQQCTECNLLQAVIGVSVITVGVIFFVIGAYAAKQALSALHIELVPLAAIIAVGGGLIAYGGIQIVIGSGCLPQKVKDF